MDKKTVTKHSTPNQLKDNIIVADKMLEMKIEFLIKIPNEILLVSINADATF